MSDDISIAPTGRARCRRCQKAIAKGELRLTHSFPSDEFDDEIHHHYHARCAMEVLPDVLATHLASFHGPFPGRRELEEDLRVLLKRLKKGTAAADVPDDAITVQGDDQGRPRGRILFCSSDDANDVRYLFQENSRTDVASSQRDYVFVLPQENPLDVGVDDPSIPILGAVVVSGTKRDDLVGELRRLSTWRQRNLPTPVIWIVEGAKKGSRDRDEIELRELLESAGFPGDEAFIFRSETVTPTALKKLAEELDTALPERAIPREARTATQRALDALVELVQLGRFDATCPVFDLLLDALDPSWPDHAARDYLSEKYGYLTGDARYDGGATWRLGSAGAVENLAIEPMSHEHIEAIERCHSRPELRDRADALVTLFTPCDASASAGRRGKKSVGARKKK